jgi:hypothetical protein
MKFNEHGGEESSIEYWCKDIAGSDIKGFKSS